MSQINARQNRPGKTAYANLPAVASRALLAVVIGLTLLPALPHKPLYIPGERSWGQVETGYTDKTLYKTIVGKLIDGKAYYETAATEHRLHNYPTAPPQVFREPTLAWVLSALRYSSLQMALLFALYAAIVVLYYRELLAAKISTFGRIVGIATAASGLSIVGITDGVYLHEIWAALLVAVSLLSYRVSVWWPAVLCGLLACFVRELAVPYLVVMALFSLYEKRWKELSAWLASIVVFVIVYAAHLRIASGLHQTGDLTSSSWIGLGGWDFVIATAKWNIVLHFLPYPFIAFALCLGIIGLAGASDDRARRAAVIIGGYLIAFLVVGRPDNYYWGILYAPLLPAGFVLAPAAIKDLLRSAFCFLSGSERIEKVK